jgi:hypothetical protein
VQTPSIVAIVAFSLAGLAACLPARGADIIVTPGYTSRGGVLPESAFPRARQPAPGTGRALDGVRNGTTREERDRHGGPEIDLSGRPVLTGRYREFQN